MQVQLKVAPTVIVTAESEKMTEVFEQLAQMQEIFGQDKCGKCGCTTLHFVVRQNKNDDKFYELRCTDPKCRAILRFGCNKKGGGLFPVRKENENASLMGMKPGEYLPNNGWLKYNPQTQKNE